MPGLDGTGPLGLGPGTGGRRGWCFNPYPLGAPWYGFRRGRGLGWRWLGAPPFWGPFFAGQPEVTLEQQIDYLETERKFLETRIAALEKEIERLKKEKANQ